VGTFMGAFNAYEIQKLKSKFNNLHSGHNMLVRVTNQQNEYNKNLSEKMQFIMEVIDLVAEYNQGLLMIQIEQLDEFKDRVSALTNAVQQLHQRWLAIYL
jgi:flagellar biosynthesis chaperone FliJ